MDVNDIINNIRNAFDSLSGEEIAEIHNNICNENVEYEGDSVWRETTPDIDS